MINYRKILKEIEKEVQSAIKKGKVANYIPKLSNIPLNKFGMVVCTIEGDLFKVGDADENFSIQSISKAYTLTLALELFTTKTGVSIF